MQVQQTHVIYSKGCSYTMDPKVQHLSSAIHVARHIAYFLVHSFASSLYFCLSVL